MCVCGIVLNTPVSAELCVVVQFFQNAPPFCFDPDVIWQVQYRQTHTHTHTHSHTHPTLSRPLEALRSLLYLQLQAISTPSSLILYCTNQNARSRPALLALHAKMSFCFLLLQLLKMIVGETAQGHGVGCLQRVIASSSGGLLAFC